MILLEFGRYEEAFGRANPQLLKSQRPINFQPPTPKTPNKETDPQT
jgi:hypothetical protein